MKHTWIYLSILPLFIVACHPKATEEEEGAEVTVQTPVTVTTVSNQNLEEFVEVNATSSYLGKNIVKASINGYIQQQTAKKGMFVKTGQVLFTLITKEAKAIGNSINNLDPSFKFSGITTVKASKSGYVSDVNHQLGDYVQEGEQLAVINDNNSFAFLMDVPYELSDMVHRQKTVQLTLPNGENLKGTVSSSLPSVDSLSQTERVIIKVSASHSIPENLIVKVKLVKLAHYQAPSILKEAVLTNETQDEFWVMKVINDTTAVKVLITKGMETDDRIEISRPHFNPQDRILINGNYGLADTAKVKIIQKK